MQNFMSVAGVIGVPISAEEHQNTNKIRRLKPLLHKRCPPPRTEEWCALRTLRGIKWESNLSSTHGGGFCLYRRGFNRPVSSTHGGEFCLYRRGFNRPVF